MQCIAGPNVRRKVRSKAIRQRKRYDMRNTYYCALAAVILLGLWVQTSFARDDIEFHPIPPSRPQSGVSNSTTGWSSYIRGLTKPLTHCTCNSCTKDVWNSLAAGATCGSRISYLIQKESTFYHTMTSACRQVAFIEYPAICGKCDPSSCDGRKPPSLNRKYYCGCQSCNLTKWKSNAGDGLSCEAHTTWLETHESMNEQAACRLVASAFPASTCKKACDPATCTGGSPGRDIYCFPDPIRRKVYNNAWGGFLVQVKESSASCGPGDNIFSQNTVSMTNNNTELKLQFKYADGSWKASEVRVVPMNGRNFSYGTYNFSVKSVAVKDSLTGTTIVKKLPASLVLGLFTWDNTDDYATHQNWNHEVDIEISQWDNPANQDTQFLVQPPESSQYRFFTGENGTIKQGGHRWQVVWNPGKVSWSTDAGGGQSNSYTTKQAILMGKPDYVQCLPANMDIRMNIWNMYGVNTPTGLQTNNVVEVVIDKFSFTPSGLRNIADGGYCSKDCQCKVACANGRCTS